MRRALVAIILGVGIGYPAAIVLTGPRPVPPSPTPHPTTTTTVVAETTGTATAATTTTTPSTSTTAPAVRTYLVWATGGLTGELTAGMVAEFDRVSIVQGDVVELVAPGGVVPLDGVAIDPDAHAPFDPDGSLAALRAGGVVLGETSAGLRGVAVGDRLELVTGSYRLVGVAPDTVVGAAEIVFSRDDPTRPVAVDRYALIGSDLPRVELEARVRAMYDGAAALRIRAEGESPWLRHGDAVLPQVFIKQALGEFSYTGLRGGSFVPDPAWVEANIVRTEVPILGEVACHRQVAARLDTAMSRLVEEGLSHLVDPTAFAGCYDPRFIRAAGGRSSGVSRHAWGAAVDINADDNPLGSIGTQDQRLIEVMIEAGFTWGGEWLVPDPMHFEYGGR
jgi:hypothetical protein